MKYDVTHSCGCTETVELLGKGEERKRRIAALESQPCPACRAAEVNAEDGFASLDGTPKQVAWAGDLRKRMIREVEGFAAKALAEEGYTEAERDQVRANIDKSIAAIRGVSSAKWFIDRRGLSPVRAFKAGFAIAEGE